MKPKKIISSVVLVSAMSCAFAAPVGRTLSAIEMGERKGTVPAHVLMDVDKKGFALIVR